MKKLPIGIQTFEKIRQDGYYYVDKTAFVKKLGDEGQYYFLSRPRRFGKSLFIDTLKEAFSGNKKLFKGLFLEKNWDWSKKYPVIRISFGAGVARSPDELETFIIERMRENWREHGFSPSNTSIPGIFHEYIVWLAKKSGQVVILFDEYDKPILDNITNTKTATEMREVLKNLYSVIKDADQYLKLVFLTGVSKFSKVSLFSGLNNLKDITLDSRFATLCGYTHEEMESVFRERLEGRNLEEIRLWYNGYNFLGEPVYNPFDVLLHLDTGEFRNFWFETGTPTFLVDLLRESRFFIPRLENLSASETLLSSFDVGSIAPETLLFQTGYLTIQELVQVGAQRTFILKYPNLEVRSSLNDFLLESFACNTVEKRRNLNSLFKNLQDGTVKALGPLFTSFFASIPHDWYRKNQVAKYEGYYASIFYSYFSALGLDLIPEDVTNHGRIDLTVKLGKYVYLFEFKVKGLAEGRSRALSQLKKNHYHEKYLSPDKTVFLIGVEFDPETRNIFNFAWETA